MVGIDRSSCFRSLGGYDVNFVEIGFVLGILRDFADLLFKDGHVVHMGDEKRPAKGQEVLRTFAEKSASVRAANFTIFSDVRGLLIS
jgi:hypothetical protein